MDLCHHSETIEDATTGDYICLECAKVLGQVMLHSERRNESKRKLTAPRNIYCAELFNICRNMNICDSVTKSILAFFQRVNKVRTERKVILMAYAIHNTLQTLGLSERVRDIEQFTGISRRDFFRINNCLNTDVEINNSTASLDIFCSSLEISFEAKREIEQFASDLMTQYSNSTNCILATSIYMYCAKHKLEKTLKIICETCDVATETVRRLRKELLHKDIFI